ncbi:hypothetical protein PG994_007067 [Apiospora phragmitis]|uniref:Uncharacterized protein n=1 Tax=Apiospora phragmitis TaxID=2905665 RepID=A0ABR1V2X8_9PEZI
MDDSSTTSDSEDGLLSVRSPKKKKRNGDVPVTAEERGAGSSQVAPSAMRVGRMGPRRSLLPRLVKHENEEEEEEEDRLETQKTERELAELKPELQALDEANKARVKNEGSRGDSLEMGEQALIHAPEVGAKAYGKSQGNRSESQEKGEQTLVLPLRSKRGVVDALPAVEQSPAPVSPHSLRLHPGKHDGSSSGNTTGRGDLLPTLPGWGAFCVVSGMGLGMHQQQQQQRLGDLEGEGWDVLRGSGSDSDCDGGAIIGDAKKMQTDDESDEFGTGGWDVVMM